jgi:RNA polymerase sigma-70 factor (ECF subfamily)
MIYAMAGDEASPVRLPSTASRSAAQNADRARLSHEDTQIVENVRAGDIEAFRALYLRTYDPLVGFATALVSSRADAEEAVQDVFASLWERRTLWSPSRSVAAYLFAAVRNRMAKLRAHGAVVSNAEHDADVVTARSAGQSPEAPDLAAEAEELRRAVARAVAELPERRRFALMLRFGQGMSYAEVGDVLGVSEHAATLLVARARDAIAPLLAPFRRS